MRHPVDIYSSVIAVVIMAACATMQKPPDTAYVPPVDNESLPTTIQDGGGFDPITFACLELRLTGCKEGELFCEQSLREVSTIRMLRVVECLQTATTPTKVEECGVKCTGY